MRFNFLSLIISLIQYAINCEDNVMETGTTKKLRKRALNFTVDLKMMFSDQPRRRKYRCVRESALV